MPKPGRSRFTVFWERSSETASRLDNKTPRDSRAQRTQPLAKVLYRSRVHVAALVEQRSMDLTPVRPPNKHKRRFRKEIHRLGAHVHRRSVSGALGSRVHPGRPASS